MKTKALLFVVLCLPVNSLLAEIYFNSGGDVFVDYLIDDSVLVTNGTHVEVADGGDITGYLRLFDTSEAIISGGDVGFLQAYHNSSFTLSDGAIGTDINTFQTSVGTITGGQVGEELVLYYNSRVHITGGLFGSSITIGKDVGDVILTFYGTDFTINGTSVDYGQYTYSDYPSGSLHGILQSGDAIANGFRIYDGSSIVLVPAPPNHLSVANAGDDQTVYTCIDEIAEVTLDGSDSNDIDGDELSYYWSWMIDDQIYDANGVGPTIELPVGEHVIELIVNDGIEDSEPNEVVITVIEPIEADLYIVPRVINRNSRGRSVMAIITLPEGIGKDDIDGEFILLPGEIAAERQLVREVETIVKVFALFSRSDLMDAIAVNSLVELTVVGRLKSGQCIYGRDSVRIVEPKVQRLRRRRRR